MRRTPVALAGVAALTLAAAACSSTSSTAPSKTGSPSLPSSALPSSSSETGTETITGTVTGKAAAAMMNTTANVQPVFPTFVYTGPVNTTVTNYTLPGGNSTAKTQTDTLKTADGNLTITHTRTSPEITNQLPAPSATRQNGDVCLFTINAETGTYVVAPAKSTGEFTGATGHGAYTITINIAATLPAGKTTCSIADYGKNGPTAIAAGTSFAFKASGPLTVKPAA